LKPLVTAVAPDETEVGVYRDDDGALWLGGHTLLEGGRPAWTGGEGWSAAGGALPPGAIAVEARHPDGTKRPAAASSGAWVAIIDGPVPYGTLPVRCLDGEGRIVPRPPRGELGEPVTDTDVSCPACDAVDWERRTWTGWGEDYSAVRCRACGHYVPMGTFISAELPDAEPTADEAAAWQEEADRHRARDIEFVLSGLRFPLYGPADRPVELVGHGSHNRALSTVTLRHGSITVETSFERSWPFPLADVVRRDLSDLVREGEEWPRLSQPALTLWLDARDRDATERAARTPIRPVPLPVEGRPVSFLRCGDDAAWAAATRVGDLQIAVTATGDCALARVDRIGSSPLPAEARWDPWA
jgi:hypothetical protein